MIGQRLGIGKVLPRLDAVELTPSRKIVVVLEPIGRLGPWLRCLLNLILNLVRVLGTVAQPRLALVFLYFRPSPLPS